MAGEMQEAKTAGATTKKMGGVASRSLGRTTIVAAAGALAILMVGSVLALLTDTVTFEGASIESNDWVDTNNPVPTPDPSDALDLRIKDGNCDPADDLTTYSDDATISMTGHQVDLATIADAGGNGMPDPVIVGTYCLHNASAFAGQLVTTLLSANSTEVGACDTSEATVDSTCNPGDAGELDLVAHAQTSSCGSELYGYDMYKDYWYSNASSSHSLSYDVGYPWTTSQLAAGGTCEISIGVWIEGFYTSTTSFGTAQDDRLLNALSDSVSFDMSIDLEEF